MNPNEPPALPSQSFFQKNKGCLIGGGVVGGIVGLVGLVITIIIVSVLIFGAVNRASEEKRELALQMEQERKLRQMELERQQHALEQARQKENAAKFAQGFGRHFYDTEITKLGPSAYHSTRLNSWRFHDGIYYLDVTIRWKGTFSDRSEWMLVDGQVNESGNVIESDVRDMHATTRDYIITMGLLGALGEYLEQESQNQK